MRQQHARVAFICAMSLAMTFSGCATGATGATGATSPAATASATTAPDPTPSPTLSTHAPPCAASQLTVVAIADGAALGHTATLLRFTNTAPNACSLQGYPTLRLLNASGHLLPVHVQGTPDAYLWATTPLNTIDLPSEGSAYARVETHNAPAQPGDSCVTAVTTLIYPPHISQGFAATLKFTTCDGHVYVSPVVATPNDL